uniref:Putative salivary secreted peptide n=1 Tax=Ixodes ricinus TaxID=34613 RepID=V5GP77_IXORI
MMPPIVPLVLWTSTLLAASSLLAVTSNSTNLGPSGTRKYNACSLIKDGNYRADSSALNTSADRYLYKYCYAHHIGLSTRVSGTALKDNKCCRVCCNITVYLPPYARHLLFDQKSTVWISMW